MMGRMSMGKQIATAPASRLPVVTQLDQMRATGMKKGGKVAKMAKGGYTRGDGACIKGHTRGMVR